MLDILILQIQFSLDAYTAPPIQNSSRDSILVNQEEKSTSLAKLSSCDPLPSLTHVEFREGQDARELSKDKKKGSTSQVLAGLTQNGASTKNQGSLCHTPLQIFYRRFGDVASAEALKKPSMKKESRKKGSAKMNIGGAETKRSVVPPAHRSPSHRRKKEKSNVPDAKSQGAVRRNHEKQTAKKKAGNESTYRLQGLHANYAQEQRPHYRPVRQTAPGKLKCHRAVYVVHKWSFVSWPRFIRAGRYMSGSSNRDRDDNASTTRSHPAGARQSSLDDCDIRPRRFEIEPQKFRTVRPS
ncbi:hypothetical protein B0H16DRAFT_1467602 [Mycena metata]|uniref:Uncharacterized protein n=1 Tax=Mycena metata TaxID=1033252 RepID=A0AAD7MVZ9_9AGAR|nr:hypothetical protein B0H16DRAFT_1467602 [Mycena metata]